MEMQKLENSICQASHGLDSDVDSTGPSISMFTWMFLNHLPTRTRLTQELQQPRRWTATVASARRGAETVDAQRMSTSGCGYHRTGRNLTVQSVLMMLQQPKQTKSGLTLRNNRLLSKQQKNRRVGAHMRCTTAARWVAGKTLETENATKGEHPEEWCTSFNACKAT